MYFLTVLEAGSPRARFQPLQLWVQGLALPLCAHMTSQGVRGERATPQVSFVTGTLAAPWGPPSPPPLVLITSQGPALSPNALPWGAGLQRVTLGAGWDTKFTPARGCGYRWDGRRGTLGWNRSLSFLEISSNDHDRD